MAANYYRMPIPLGNTINNSMPKDTKQRKSQQEIIKRLKELNPPFQSPTNQQETTCKKYNRIFDDSIARFHGLPSEVLICEDIKDSTSKLLDSILKVENAKPETLKQNPVKHNKPNNLALVNSAAWKYSSIDDQSFSFGAIRSVLEKFTNKTYSSSTASSCHHVPVLNITGATALELRSLLQLFKPNTSKSASKETMIQELLKFIPVTTAAALPLRESTTSICSKCSVLINFCSGCGQKCCIHKPLKVCSYPRTGFSTSMLCMDCISYCINKDAEDWAAGSFKILTESDDTTLESSIIASLGCALIAIALGYDSLKLLKKLASYLHSKCMHAAAYSILNLAISLCKKSDKEKPRLFFLASSVLLEQVKSQMLTVEEKCTLIAASREAFDTAKDSLDKSTEVPGEKRAEIEKLENQLHQRRKEIFSQRLESFWKDGDVVSILKEYNYYEDSGEHTCLVAFKTFLESKESFLPSMPSTDQLNLKFLMGVLKLKEEENSSALTDFEFVAWNIITSRFPAKFMLGAYMHMLTNCYKSVYYLEHLLQLEIKNLFFSKPIDALEKSVALLFPSDKELTPPFKMNWPSIFNSSSHQKFEELIMHSFNTKNCSNMQVAGAYLDQVTACKNSAEKIFCYLHAAMWIIRNFNSESKYDVDVLFAYKSILVDLLRLSCETAMYRVCNPGMELYVSRLAIGIIRKITFIPNSHLVFTNDDVYFLQKLLQRLLEVSHMFPFWKFPSISLSEADLFNTFTAMLHADFLFELQFLKPEHRPVNDHELMYRLHHNDVLGFLPLSNSSDCRARAMNELLKSQGLSWNDVRQTMSTKLCPRDEEGWITPSPELGVPLEYSELVGFIFDANGDQPSVKLLVVEANPEMGIKGLFSQEDINVFLQLDPNDLITFSLDPPSDDLAKRYHPFNQWRYSTEKIRDTEVLKTMFTADYLMKSFSTDTDISSLPPFKQRSCKHNLTKDLPPELQAAVCPIAERCSQSKAWNYRFWIESKGVKYKIQQNEFRYEYQFGEADMEINCQSLPDSIDGSLNSAKEDSDPNSPHATFASDMTANYSELGKYFPVFARLQQLSKLQFFSIELQVLVNKLKEKCPEKKSSLTRFIETYKQPQTPKPTSKCEWVPAVTSPKQRSICYGGVQLVGTTNPVTGCYGNSKLGGAFHNITCNSSILHSLHHIRDSSIEGVIDCKSKIQAAYIIEKNGKVLVHQSNDVFRKVEWVMNSVGDDLKYCIIPIQKNLPPSIVNSAMDELYAVVYKTHGQATYKSPEDFSSHLMELSCDSWDNVSNQITSVFSKPVGGVKFSGKGTPCQSYEIFPQPKNVSEVLIQVKPSTAAPVEPVSYFTPVGNAERQNNQSLKRFNSWNETGLEEKKSTSLNSSYDARNASAKISHRVQNTAKLVPKENPTVVITGLLHDEPEITSPVKQSTFRQRNSTGLNKQLDKLYHSFQAELLLPLQQ